MMFPAPLKLPRILADHARFSADEASYLARVLSGTVPKYTEADWAELRAFLDSRERTRDKARVTAVLSVTLEPSLQANLGLGLHGLSM